MKDRQTRIKSRVSSRKIVWPSARQYLVIYSHVEFHLLQLLSVRGETARKGNFSELSRFVDTLYFLYFVWISGLVLSCSLIWQKKNKNSLWKRERLSRLIINLGFLQTICRSLTAKSSRSLKAAPHKLRVHLRRSN